MSRIGKKPISIEPDVKILLSKETIDIEGPCGKMQISIPEELEIVENGTKIEVKIKEESKKIAALYGLFRSLLQNAISGVKKEWQKSLEMVGVGYRAQTDGKELILNLGFSHPVKIQAPEGIKFTVVENKIKVMGVNKYLVGEVTARVRQIKPPEPYKGKGIRYEGEFIRKKLGKAAKTVGAVASGSK